ncbi:type VI secretion system ImpA family N-terminal domain-containing protein [Photobacterium sp. SDRW27]|uniref:type VI secretion system protein TssA n=1 Tax=Photobacterium obscurum TaxID=2829490 RepID=UPI002242C7E3|nr:type VI secretion system ImpA family N-terminal domain-containing protein [Photobacterium obscurum]MCW8327860.1 type VI secretion system ImpA family N-terminal domain-containing protein [Photobacterium obscurum]
MKFTESQRQSLLSPLKEDNFCGLYLKSDRQAFRPLRNEFNLAQTSLRKLTQNPERSELDVLLEENIKNWNILSDSLANVFANSSRDIELASWMMAAQIIIDPSLAGVKELALWLEELVTAHWETLHPVLPENKIKAEGESEKLKEINAFKVKAFVQLLGESEDSGLLYSPLLMTPLIGDLDFARYQSEEHKGNLSELRSQYHNLALTERTKVVCLINNLECIKTTFVAIDQKVTAICQQNLLPSVGFNFVISLFNKILRAIEFISGLKPSATAAPVDDSQPILSTQAEEHTQEATSRHQDMQELPAVNQSVSISSLATQQVVNRDQVFHQLRDIADYFRKTEPHSPVAYLLEKAIRWGYMPLPELMTELLSNQQETIDRVFNLTGLDEDGVITLPEVKQPVATTPVLSTPAVTSEPEPAVEMKPVSPVIETEKTPNQEPQKTEQQSKSSGALQW